MPVFLSDTGPADSRTLVLLWADQPPAPTRDPEQRARGGVPLTCTSRVNRYFQPAAGSPRARSWLNLRADFRWGGRHPNPMLFKSRLCSCWNGVRPRKRNASALSTSYDYSRLSLNTEEKSVIFLKVTYNFLNFQHLPPLVVLTKFEPQRPETRAPRSTVDSRVQRADDADVTAGLGGRKEVRAGRFIRLERKRFLRPRPDHSWGFSGQVASSRGLSATKATGITPIFNH